MQNVQQKYLTEKQVASLTGIALSTLRNHRSKRKGLPYIKYGGSVRYNIEVVEEHMEGCKIQHDD